MIGICRLSCLWIVSGGVDSCDGTVDDMGWQGMEEDDDTEDLTSDDAMTSLPCSFGLSP